jgi:putative ABC transport system permease protein
VAGGSLIVLALRMLRRDWRSGELGILLLALVVAVGSVTTVGFFADRVQQGISQQANQLLGADLVVVADRGVPEAAAGEAARRGLATARSLRFPSMVGDGEQAVLSEVKAVSDAYPLRGQLKIARVWTDPRSRPAEFPTPGRCGWTASWRRASVWRPAARWKSGPCSLRWRRW